MSAPAYTSLSFDLASSFIKASMSLASTFQGIDNPNDSYDLPTFPHAKLTSGTGAGQFNCFSKLYEVSATGVTNYDLTSLVDPLGNALNLTTLKYILVANFATTAGYKLLLDGTVSNAFGGLYNGITTGKIPVQPGYPDSGSNPIPGLFLTGTGAAAGLGTVGSTSKIVAVDAGANTVAHAIMFFGVA